jgi:hypothetical protein
LKSAIKWEIAVFGIDPLRPRSIHKRFAGDRQGQ